MKSIIPLATLVIGLTAPEIAAQETREFQANQMQIAEARRISKYYYGKYYASNDSFADGIDMTCKSAKNENSLENLTTIRVYAMQKLDRSQKLELIDFYVAVDVTALSYVCPEYKYLLRRR